MPRRRRIIVEGQAHHVTQRGNYQQYVFEDHFDYKQYCEIFQEYSEKLNVEIVAYCLMGNHVHFILIPETRDVIGKLFNIVNMRYAQYMNYKRKKKGHLWQGRYFSCVLGDDHLLRAIRYVEMNPVRANMVVKPWEYLWSSARYRLKLEKDSLIKISNHEVVDRIKKDVIDWRQYLEEDDHKMVEEMRLKTLRGLVVGANEFVKGLEIKFNRSLRCLPLGRPKKGS
jgi:putative transposase